jgi:hypothetical protein
VPSTAVDFLQAGCKQASTTTNRFILNIYILHLRVLLYSGLFLTLLQNSTGSTGWGDISLLGALKFTLSHFSWWEQGLQAACFDSLPATNGREKVGANGQWGQPGLLPSQIAQATTHQRYRPCMGLQLASQAMGRGAQSRAEHACNATRVKGWPQGSFGIALSALLCTALQAATRPTIDKKRRNISSCRAMDHENSFTSCGSTADREDPTYLASGSVERLR